MAPVLLTPSFAPVPRPHRYQKLKKFGKVYDKIEALRQNGQYGELAAQLDKARAIDNTTPFFVSECVGPPRRLPAGMATLMSTASSRWPCAS